MDKKEALYAGKAKSVYKTDNADELIIHYRDDTSAFDGEKVAQLANKGKVNNYFNAFIMEKLAEAGVKTHFIRLLNDQESLVKHLKMLPIECVVRNYAAGSLVKRLGVEEGLALEPPTFEFFLKNDALHDPMINDYHIQSLGWGTAEDIEEMKAITFQVNTILKDLFQKAGILLVDYKLEFGRQGDTLYLGDEFSPDGCRLWDADTKKKLDKDRFRQGLGSVVESYLEVAERLGIDIPMEG